MASQGGTGYLQVQAPTYAEQLLRSLQINGDLPGLVQAEFGASYQLDDMRQPEFWWLRRGRRFAQGQTIGGVAGQFSCFDAYISTGLPAGTVIAIIEQMTLCAYAAGVTFNIALRPLPQRGAFVATEFGQLDDRQAPFTVGQPVSQLPALNLQSYNNATAGGAISGAGYQVNVPANSAVTLQLPFVLTGRAVLRVSSDANNVAAGCSLTWRERELLSSEL